MISLCMICGNESAVIVRCLESAAGAFDELCLVRAIGEAVPDDTLVRAGAWCARHGKSMRSGEYLNVIPGRKHVGDYAAARQMSFDLATGDWIMWLDCDDRLTPETPARIRALAATENGPPAWSFAYRLPGGAYSIRERLFRRGVGRWSGIVHETFELPLPARIDDVAAVVHAPLTVDRESSHTRNLTLLRDATHHTQRYLFYLHEELYWRAIQRHDGAAQAEAVEMGKAALEITPAATQMEERYEILLNLGELDKAHEEDWFTQALRLQPWRREALSYLCQRALRLGQRSEALSWFRLMDALPRPQPLPWTHREIWHGWARNYLRVRVLRLCMDPRAVTEHAENMRAAAYRNGVAAYESSEGVEPVEPLPELIEKHGGRKVLILCPTRGRPERCAQMIESFIATRRADTRLICYVAEDDPKLAAYQEYATAPRTGAHFRNIYFEFGPRLTAIQVWNRALEFPADFYGDTGDDHLYRTEGWDVRLIAALHRNGGRGYAFPRNENLPGTAIISADCVRALGYYFPPCFRHQYADNAIRDLYESAGLFFHVPDVWIEHVHPFFGKVPMDPTYQPMLDAGAADAAAYEKWRAEDFASDLARLQKVEKHPNT